MNVLRLARHVNAVWFFGTGKEVIIQYYYIFIIIDS